SGGGVAIKMLSFCIQEERAEQGRPTEVTNPQTRSILALIIFCAISRAERFPAGLSQLPRRRSVGLESCLHHGAGAAACAKGFRSLCHGTTVMGYLIVFMDAGLSTATVQRENITQAQVSNLFWINVALSSAAALVLATSSPLVAWLYREPR